MIVDTTDLLSLTQAAQLSGYMTEAQVRGHVRRGNVACVRIGAALFVTRAALEELLKREGVR
jgi:hypothetical protein